MNINKIFTNLALTLFVFLFALVLITNYISIILSDQAYTLNLVAEISILGGILLVSQILLYLVYRKKIINDNFLILLFIFIFYVFFWSLLNFFSYGGLFNFLATLQTLETLILWFSLLFIGYNLNFESKLKYFVLFSFWLSLFSTIIFSIQSNTIMIYTKLFFENQDVDVGYQYLSRALLVIIVFSSAFIEKDIWRSLLLIAGAFLLFSIGSRSEFFAFIFSIFFIFSINFLRIGFSIKYIIGIFFLFGLSSFLFYNYLDVFLESRFSDILNMENSTSWNARENSQDVALKQIEEFPLFGKYGGHISEYGIRGYSHNILSAWVNYGLIGFLLYFSLVFYSFLYSLKFYLTDKNVSKGLWVTTILSLISLILVISSKSIFWPFPALVWGMLLRFRLKSN
ncbi:O-antigen ligase family protein [Acinetobacter towneri]|uniref:O-antigen ligase family protein n=1 Tax=Acinetobacter towneri TaxID=202956 RepID=UPI0029349148|nr:O-antigen ligase family protein [Acinetobacter towneri]WOE28758.1 hypothetical protein QSG83_15730 [Acinetobacter towneri]